MTIHCNTCTNDFAESLKREEIKIVSLCDIMIKEFVKCVNYIYIVLILSYIIYIWSFSWDYLHIQCWQCLWLWMKMNWQWMNMMGRVSHRCRTFLSMLMLNALLHTDVKHTFLWMRDVEHTFELRPWTFFWMLITLKFCASTFNTFCAVCT